MRTFFFCLLTGLLGLAIGLIINWNVVGGILFPPPPPSIQSESHTADSITEPASNPPLSIDSIDHGNIPSPASRSEVLVQHAYAVLSALKSKNYASFSSMVHPEKGVTFTPYSTVDIASNQVFRPIELSKLSENEGLYIWGAEPNGNTPIQLTIEDYLDRYVYNLDFISAPFIGVNKVLSSGNALENVTETYPDCEFVEFYIPVNNGLDWSGLKLVFEYTEKDPLLVGIIHSEWTG